MKLYVWANPYSVSYGSSMVFAVAETEEAAREQCTRGVEWKYGDLGSGEVQPWMAKVELGKPSRVVDLPCAEWHEWSE